jgi:hypothetical protein
MRDTKHGASHEQVGARPKVKRVIKQKPLSDKEREDVIADARQAVEQGFASDDQYALAFRGVKTW